MSEKIFVVSHCYKDAYYGTPGGDSIKYKQAQVVDSLGRVWALVQYWADRYDAHISSKWERVELPALPEVAP